MTKGTVPTATVPVTDQSQDQTVVTDVKTYTQREADMLARVGSLPVGSIILKDPVDVETPIEDTPEIPEEIKMDEEPIPDEVETVDETPVEKEKSEKSEYDEDGFKYGTLGSKEYKQTEDGTVYWKTKINGIEEWLTDRAVMEGFQLRKYSDQKLQEIAKREKELESMREIDSVMDRYMGSRKPVKQPVNTDDDFDDLLDAPADNVNEGELAQLRRELAEVKGILSVSAKEKEEYALIQQRGERMEASYAEVREFYGNTGIDLPAEPDDRIMARVDAYAANNGTTPDVVFEHPTKLLKALKGIKPKKSSPKDPPSSPEQSKKVKVESESSRLLKRLAVIKADFNNQRVINPAKANVEIMSIHRKLKELEGT